jgi:hypothetical protein
MEKGKTYLYSKSSEMTIPPYLLGAPAAVLTENWFNTQELVEWTVQGVDGKGNLIIQNQTKAMACCSKAGETVFDSRDESKSKNTLPTTDIAFDRRLMGTKLTLTATPTGKITAVKGYKEMMAALVKNKFLTPELFDANTDDGTRQFLEFIPQLPKQPVKPGDTWEVPFEFKIPKGALKESITSGKKIYTYLGESKVGKRKTVKIKVLSEQSTDLEYEMDGLKSVSKSSITSSKGEIEFDPKEGCLVLFRNEYTVTNKGTVTFNGVTSPTVSTMRSTFAMRLVEGAAK